MSSHASPDPHELYSHRRPDFLVISPPKTGSTWLADNLRCHPQLFVPAIKELKYFSSLFKWLDFGWYCDHFEAAGRRLAGEATPSYASLSLADIQAIRRVLPDIKLVFLMRDPVSRAWSHAKHNRRYREANFADAPPDTGTTSTDQWRENFGHDWPLVSGDYLGQLRRWTSVFPAEQLFVGFYESITTRPDALLRDVFQFLGVRSDIDLSGFPVHDRILVGPEGQLPADLATILRGILQARTMDLAELLRDRFSLNTPPEWQTTLAGAAEAQATPPRAFGADDDDEYLVGVSRSEEMFASAHRLILSDYRGYDIVFHRGHLYGVARARGPIAIVGDVPTRDQCLAEGTCVTAQTLPELKERITDQLLRDAAAHTKAVEVSLQQLREREFRETRATLQRLETQLAAVSIAISRGSLARRVLRAIRNPVRPTKRIARAILG